jgi:hypothetical protein
VGGGDLKLRPHWTAQEDDYLRRHYCDCRVPIKRIAATLGRTAQVVYAHASKLGLQRQHRWTKEEDETLRQCWSVLGRAATARKLGRSLGSVLARAYDLRLPFENGIRNWTTQEEAFLLEVVNKAAAALHRTPGAVLGRLNLLFYKRKA